MHTLKKMERRGRNNEFRKKKKLFAEILFSVPVVERL